MFKTSLMTKELTEQSLKTNFSYSWGNEEYQIVEISSK